MGMNSACLQRCSALLETAALHARVWKEARGGCIKVPRQVPEIGTGRRADPEGRFLSLRAEGAGQTAGEARALERAVAIGFPDGYPADSQQHQECLADFDCRTFLHPKRSYY